ncbi:two-component system sensor kinase [Streptomyces himastatinicus ATCC 53653]|uniref:histidine kinase n=1 Tax=Streptomyces himastatinicus ATCC 53653 TaxID=457427 RepID=D9WUU9_9ACTN|nr:histidine kinase [Streptomyces himastatinicus]EFL26481.1 two-component system sensor kinase [Streptomyces himastatinicus ATCC 53653]
MGTSAGNWSRHGLRLVAGLLIGAVTAVAELLYTVAAGLTLLSVTTRPRARARVLRPLTAGARWLTEAERRRLARFLDARITSEYGGEQALRYLATRWALGLLGGVVPALAAIGAGFGSLLLWGVPVLGGDHWFDLIMTGFGGVVLFILAAQGVVAVAAWEARLARHLLGPSPRDALHHRIEELAASRAGVVDAVDEERRRIERDLHDGVQQRLVALGMLLGRARRSRDAERAHALLVQAHEESRQALSDLREVAWRAYPAALDEAGLRVALEGVAERSAIPVRLEYGLAAEPGTRVRTVAYFVVSEAVTNAVKHSGASRIEVALTDTAAGVLLVRITDDGTGGADPAGGGLLGLARRAAALDGRLRVVSPPGGPTTITAELPCLPPCA